MLVNMKEILEKAREGKYAVGLFNAVNVEMARAIIETAEELNAPVIVGTAEVLLPAMNLERVAEYLVPMAKKAKVPVCVHYDHGLTFEKCMEALQLGFSSVMYDCSTDSYEDNVAKVAEMVKICHAMGASVEGELGHVGDNEGSAEGSDHLLDPSAFFTDVSLARDFVERTGVDALAVAVGNAHGDYKFPPSWTLTGSPTLPTAPAYLWCSTAAAACPTVISAPLYSAASARSTSSPTSTRPVRQASKRASPPAPRPSWV